MPYKIEDLIYPGMVPAATPKETPPKSEAKESSILKSIAKSVETKRKEVPKSLEEDKPSKSVAPYPTITKEKGKVKAMSTISTPEPIVEEEPEVEVPELNPDATEAVLKTLRNKREETAESEVSDLDSYNRVRYAEQKLQDAIDEELAKREYEDNCNEEICMPIKKEFDSGNAVKVALDALKVVVLSGVGVGFVALVVRGIQLLFSI